MLNPSLVFSIIAACISVGGVLIGIGVYKAKVAHSIETDAAQNEQIKLLASKAELTSAVKHIDEHIEASIKRSDEILAVMKERAEEDRAKNQGQYKEFYSLLNTHEKRISALETQQTSLTKSLDEIKNDIKTGFKETQAELKELRNLK